MKLSHLYAHVSGSEIDLSECEKKSSDALLEDSDTCRGSKVQIARNGLYLYLTCVAFVLACGLAFVIGTHWEPNFAQRCLEHVSFNSPVLRAMEQTFNFVQFNGSLGFPSPYRGEPTPELDAAWNELEEIMVMGVSKEDALAAGGTLSDARLPEEMGGGYMASVEVVHQLHCLNFLRKATFEDYYMSRSKEFADLPHTVRLHLDHCIEMLRQYLMCNADPGIYTHRWIENYPRPYPNFNTWHKCRDFDSVIEYARSHQIRPPPGWHFSVPPDAYVFPEPQEPSEAPSLEEIFGVH